MTVTLRPFAAFALLAWSPAFAQTICHDPPAGMSCPGDRLVWCNTPSLVYHFEGQRYFGCTKTGKFLCQHDADLKGIGRRATGSRDAPRRHAMAAKLAAVSCHLTAAAGR
jgi:hypothetical protein